MSFLRSIVGVVLPVFLILGCTAVAYTPAVDLPLVYAQDLGGDEDGGDLGGDEDGGDLSGCENCLTNPLKAKSIEGLVLAIIDVILVFLIPVIVLYIMYAGFLFVKAQGNPAGISEAKRALVAALIGGVIVLGARTILDIVKGTIDAVRSDSAVSDHIPYV